jgi:hypothetical protein
VFARARTLFRTILGAAGALPVVILVIYLLASKGSLTLGPDGDKLVVKSGANVVADTGLSKDMVSPDAWSGPQKVDADYATRAMKLLRPRLRALVAYATTRDGSALEELRKDLDSPEAWWAVFAQLEPIARGAPAELTLVRQALADPLTAPAAFDFLQRVAQRREGAFADVLAELLLAPDAQARRQAARVVGALPIQSRLARTPPPPSARRARPRPSCSPRSRPKTCQSRAPRRSRWPCSRWTTCPPTSASTRGA